MRWNDGDIERSPSPELAKGGRHNSPLIRKLTLALIPDFTPNQNLTNYGVNEFIHCSRCAPPHLVCKTHFMHYNRKCLPTQSPIDLLRKCAQNINRRSCACHSQDLLSHKPFIHQLVDYKIFNANLSHQHRIETTRVFNPTSSHKTTLSYTMQFFTDETYHRCIHNKIYTS